MLIGVVGFGITDVMEALTKKGFNVRLGDLGELLRITKYNHGWPPLMDWMVLLSLVFLLLGCKKKARKCYQFQAMCGAAFKLLNAAKVSCCNA